MSGNLASRATAANGILGILLLVIGTYIGLFIAPADRFMGDIQRIMYVHVPCAWATMVCFSVSLVAAIGWVVDVGMQSKQAGVGRDRRWGWDDALEASIEVGVMFGVLLVVQGMIWAKPTWGVYWTWDPRLTTVAVMELMFVAVLALRSFVDEPVRRATWSAVATLVAYVNVPLVYFSVQWWSSLHQVQSTGKSVDPEIWRPLGINALAILFISIAFMIARSHLARLNREALLAGDESVGNTGGAS